jgi:HlyD family secretion protein
MSANMNRKKLIIFIAVASALILAIVIYSKLSRKKISDIFSEVKRGRFEVLVTVTGELQAINSENIMGPMDLRSGSFRYFEIKIQDLIPEGTMVDSGSYVAQLDRNDAGNKLKDIEDELQKIESQYIKTKLDTTMQLRDLRDQLINLKFELEEAQIALDQSQFEPPATIRQATINLDKKQRAYTQAMTNYKLKVEQAEANMREVSINLAQQTRRRDDMVKLLGKFTIYAPKKGMLIYYKDWSGQKRKVGSTINPWDLIIATLPDLSSMVSKTYVNEIDISKVHVGQPVNIGIDAFPGRHFTGRVFEVANVGEQLPNTDAKVFEVMIKVNETDSIMRPSMTTGNSIVTSVFENVVYVPLEAIHSKDSVTFVYCRNHAKQIVLLGESNENEVIIEKGLAEHDQVYLSLPENAEKFKEKGSELIPIIKSRARQKLMKDFKGNTPDTNKIGPLQRR